MSLHQGNLLGHYELVALLGRGGMGEVYRAHDSRLGRDVALKICAEQFSHRFEREAHAIAALNHPNVCHLYDVGPNYLVMELVDGHPPKGPLPLETALNYARQIAEALAAAHEKGIVHRDLKPANIKVTRDGVVKVLDFGLAKAAEQPQDSYDPDNSPTVLTSQTSAGMLIGTAAYMSPEQARGEPVDKRTDIWAFGCVLYELLTGKSPFQRKTASDILAAILKEEPDWSRIPPSAQPLLRACLRKDPKQRLHDIADAKLLLESAPEATPARSARWRWAIAGIIGILIASMAWSLLHRPAAVSPPVTRWTAAVPNKGRVWSLALSPDGSYLAYSVGPAGEGQIYVRRTDQLESKAITGADIASRALFFSPDSKWIGYYAENELRKIPAAGGSSVTICNAPGLWGASWGPDGSIVFGVSPGFRGGLMRVSADGGVAQTLTTPDPKKGELDYDNPEFLPGGKAILFTIRMGSLLGGETQLAALDLRTHRQRVLVTGATNARYAPTGHLLFQQRGSVFAAPFDAEHLEMKGPPVEVIPDIGLSSRALYAFSKWGTLVYYRASTSVEPGLLAWVDRKGSAEPIPAPTQAYANPSISPNGENIAVNIENTESNRWDIWIYSIARHTLTRLTSGGIDLSPIWTADGKRVTFTGIRMQHGTNGIFWIPADLSGPSEELYESRLPVTPGSWLRDGSALVFYDGFPPKADIWLLPGFANGKRTGQHNPIPLVQSAAPILNDLPQLSPDGHWLAYSSNTSGRFEVYVQPFPGPGGKSQISMDGGDYVRWARNGRELFYRNGDKMMAVEIQTQPVFRAGTPKLLFEGAYGHPPPTLQPGFGYDVAPDGKHFLMVKPVDEASSSPQLQVVENWFEELKREAGK